MTLQHIKYNILHLQIYNNNQARSEPGNYGNQEQEYYLPEQVTLYNGTLVITAIKANYSV